MVVQLAHAPLPVAPAVGALSLTVAGGGGRPCAHAETLLCLQFLDLFDMPIIVHRQVRSLCGDVVDTLVVAQSQIPMVRFLRFSNCSTLIRWSSYCTCKAVEDSRVPTVAAFFLDKVVDMPVVFIDKCPWFSVQKTAVVPQLSHVSMVADVPVVQVVLVPLSAAMEVPLIRSSPESMDILLCNREGYSTSSRAGYGGDAGVFGAFCAIFRASPVVPELSASFSSFRALTPVSARGLQGCRSRRECTPR